MKQLEHHVRNDVYTSSSSYEIYLIEKNKFSIIISLC